MAQPLATITHRDSTRELGEGDQVTLGRSSQADLQVGGAVDAAGEDLGVSRTAATVYVRDGRLWVRNDSSTQPVYLVPEVGPARTLEHQDEIASLPEQRVTLQLRGRIRTHEVQLELREPPVHSGPAEGGPPTAAGDPVTQVLLDVSPAERRILSALCEPLLVERGDRAKPASYAQAAERLYLSRSRVENCVADLVKRFGSAGVPGLEGPEAKDNLCRYAVRTGSITVADLDLIE